MKKIIKALNDNKRYYLISQVKKVVGITGNYYKKLNLKDGSTVLINLLNKNYDAGAKLIAAEYKGKYYIISFKRNKIVNSLNISNRLQINGLEQGLKILAENAKEKNFLQYYKKFSPKDFAKQLLIKESFSQKYFDTYFPELKGILQDDNETTHKIGNFEVIYESSLKDSTKKAINDFIIAASDIVKKFGLEKLLYGKVIIVDRLPGKTVADYSESNDLIRIQKKAKNNKSSIKDLIHELGHRLLDRGFLKDKIDVIKKFDQDVARARREVRVGDIFEDKDGKKITIEDSKFTGRRLLYIFSIEGKKGKYQAPENYFLTFKKIKGKEDKQLEWIPSTYSTTNYSEWLSEIFSYGLVDNNKLYKEYIKSILK